ncbi:MAG: tetratricopeptide repeat protein [Deltaproteobacteria bacterium]|nr:tetratricopeptide repeat protein [Deltaproteobacteria bacterium]
MKFLRGLIVVVVALVFLAGPVLAGEKIAKVTPEMAKKALKHQEKGNMLDDEGKFSEAIEEYKKSLEYNPGDPATLFNLGVVYLKINKAKEAIPVFEKLVKISPDDFEAYNLLGLAYRGEKRETDAQKVWNKSLSINPTQPQVKEVMKEKQ